MNVRRITTDMSRMRRNNDDLPERIDRMGQDFIDIRECLYSAFHQCLTRSRGAV